MSGEASTTSPSLPSRSRSPVIASCRSASIVTQLPIEWAMMSMRLAPERATSRSVSSNASRAALALLLS
jgi:hypothetical protein